MHIRVDSTVVIYYSSSTHLDIIAYTLLYIGVLVGPDLGSSEIRARDPYPCRFEFSNPPASGPCAALPPLSQRDAKSRFC